MLNRRHSAQFAVLAKRYTPRHTAFAKRGIGPRAGRTPRNLGGLGYRSDQAVVQLQQLQELAHAWDSALQRTSCGTTIIQA